MICINNRFLLVAAALVVALSFSGSANAGVISSGPFDVGIDVTSTVYDFPSGIGFRRNADGYDPIAPGTPRDSWGVSAGAVSGWADPTVFGNVNLSHVAVFGGATATVTSVLNAGGGDLLSIVQDYTFVADNIAKISTTITNVSGAAQAVLFQRNPDWDVAPTVFAEIIAVDPTALPVIDASFFGFENPDPLVAYGSSGAGGGIFGPGDLGGGIKIDLGVLGVGASTSFDYYYGISLDGQTALGLKAQAMGLGADYVITGNSSEGGGFNLGANSVIIGFGVGAVPEPASMTLLAAGALGLAGYTLRRRKK